MTYHDAVSSGRAGLGYVKPGVVRQCPLSQSKLRSFFNHIHGKVECCGAGSGADSSGNVWLGELRLGKVRNIFNHIRLASALRSSLWYSWLRHGKARFVPAFRGKVRNYSLSRCGILACGEVR